MPNRPPVFLAPDGTPLPSWQSWQALHPALHWKPGRSAMLLAQSWGGAGDIPSPVRSALEQAPPLAGLTLDRGYPEHDTPAPGRGAGSKTDLLAEASSPALGPVVIGVEGKVDEGFDRPVAQWLRAGTSERSAANRKYRVTSILGDLGLELEDSRVLALPYQLLHRCWAALQEARKRQAGTAVFLVHSFAQADAHGSGWAEFRALLGVMGVEGDVGVGEPVQIKVPTEVELWAAWVEEAVEDGRPSTGARR